MFKAVRLFGVGLLSVLLLSGTGVAETYKIDAGHSSVDFSIRHLVGRTSGHFNTFSGTVMYDPAHPEKTSVEATIETGSIDTGNEKRDGHLRNDDFFDVELYPTIVFESTSVMDNTVTGMLNFHGVENQVSFSFNETTNGVAADFLLDTTPFNMKYVGVNKDVRITFNFEN